MSALAPRRRVLAALPAVAATTAALPAAAQPSPAPTPAGCDWLVRGAAVLTMDPDRPDLPRGDILVRDGRIAAVGADLPAPDGVPVLDGAGRVAMPGLVDAHVHLAQALQRGLSADHTFAEYFRTVVLRYSNRMAPEEVRIGCLGGALAGLATGTTTVCDWNREATTGVHAEAALDGLRRSGARAVFLPTAPPRPADSGDGPLREMVARTRALRDRAGPLVTVGACLPGPDFGPLDPALADLAALRDLAGGPGAVVAFHGAAPIYALRKPRLAATLAERGMLFPGLQVVHANDLTEEDLSLLRANGVTVVSTPEVELRMGHGHPIWARARAAGVPAGLGTDIPSSVGGGMLPQARIAAAAELARRNAESFARDGRAPERLALRAREMLEALTLGGARALGLGGVTGSLTPGKRADILLVRVEDAALAPALNAAGAVALQASPAEIETVMVDGALRKRDGRLTDPDLPAILAELRERAARMVAAAG